MSTINNMLDHIYYSPVDKNGNFPSEFKDITGIRLYDTFLDLPNFEQDLQIQEAKQIYGNIPLYLLGGTYIPETPPVIAKKLPNKYKGILHTYYPGSSKYPIGHSELDLLETTFGGLLVNSYNFSKTFNSPKYNLITNNCSNETCNIIQAGFSQKPDVYLFTTPGDVKDYAEFLGGLTKFNAGKGYAETILNLSEDQYNKMLNSKGLLNSTELKPKHNVIKQYLDSRLRIKKWRDYWNNRK